MIIEHKGNLYTSKYYKNLICYGLPPKRPVFIRQPNLILSPISEVITFTELK